jgi:hypothetical protein
MKSMHCNVAFLISLLQALRLLAAVSILLCDLKNDFALKDGGVIINCRLIKVIFVVLKMLQSTATWLGICSISP